MDDVKPDDTATFNLYGQNIDRYNRVCDKLKEYQDSNPIIRIIAVHEFPIENSTYNKTAFEVSYMIDGIEFGCHVSQKVRAIYDADSIAFALIGLINKRLYDIECQNRSWHKRFISDDLSQEEKQRMQKKYLYCKCMLLPPYSLPCKMCEELYGDICGVSKAKSYVVWEVDVND